MLSSYAHSLGVYTVPFDSINYENQTPMQMQAPIIQEKKKTKAEKEDFARPPEAQGGQVQGVIATTKAPDLRRSESSEENKLNQRLIMKKDKSLEESIAIVQKPVDKPINLDINGFLGETQKTRKDIDIINEVYNPF